MMMLDAVLLLTLAGWVAADFDPELHAKYLAMSKSSFIEYFNAQDYSWKMAEYDNIEDKYTRCGLLDMEAIENLPVQTHDLETIDLPDNFDARDKWPQCETIKEIYDQGNCDSCWTFGCATSASDRTCIHKDVHVRLAEQDLECLKQFVCMGGNAYDAFIYWQDEGLVTHECKPYDTRELFHNICVTECVNTDINYKKDKHFAEKVYRVSNDSDQIKAELVKNGPIQAAFTIFYDLKRYKSGIYVHKHGIKQGHHSVRVVGYGVEDGIDYWLVANSWGGNWGEYGWFRIKSYQKELGFENYLIAGMPKN